MTRITYELQSFIAGLYYAAGGALETAGMFRQNIAIMVLGILMFWAGKHCMDNITKQLIGRNRL